MSVTVFEDEYFLVQYYPENKAFNITNKQTWAMIYVSGQPPEGITVP